MDFHFPSMLHLLCVYSCRMRLFGCKNTNNIRKNDVKYLIFCIKLRIVLSFTEYIDKV